MITGVLTKSLGSYQQEGLPGEKHFLTVGSAHIQYCILDNITQARATYCTK